MPKLSSPSVRQNVQQNQDQRVQGQVQQGQMQDRTWWGNIAKCFVNCYRWRKGMMGRPAGCACDWFLEKTKKMAFVNEIMHKDNRNEEDIKKTSFPKFSIFVLFDVFWMYQLHIYSKSWFLRLIFVNLSNKIILDVWLSMDYVNRNIDLTYFNR